MKSIAILIVTLINIFIINSISAQDCPAVNYMKNGSCFIVEYNSEEEALNAVSAPAETVIVTNSPLSDGIYIAQMMAEGNKVIFSQSGVCPYDNYEGAVVGTFQFTHTGLTCTYGTSGLLLPVEFAYFKGSSVNEQAFLEWGTATEIENDGFEIARSSDGKNFEKIGYINGEGNSNSEINYVFTDRNPSAGINYYRLKQVDYNGEYAYSDIVIVEIKEERTVDINYELGSESLILTADNEISKVEIYNMAGSRLMEVNDSFGIGENRINIQSLISGNYVLVATDFNGITNTKRFIKL